MMVSKKIAYVVAFSLTLSLAAALEGQKGRFSPEKDTKQLKDAIRLKSADEEAKSIDATLYNYGGNAVVALTKTTSNALNFNDTQATTVAALGNAALILGGALLFGRLSNRLNARTSSHLFPPPPPLARNPSEFRKKRLNKGRFRKRRLPMVQKRLRPAVGGRRRLRKKYEVRPRDPFMHREHHQQHSMRPGAYNSPHLNNQRIYSPLDENLNQKQNLVAQTRDEMIPIEKDTYTEEASVLAPVRPLSSYDYDDQPMVEDYYYGDYYEDVPIFSPLKGSVPPSKKPNKEPNQPPMPEIKTATMMARQPTEKPTKLNDPFKEKRTPSRQEMLLKMSEEKQREKLQKERAKLLEETLLNHQKPEKTEDNTYRNQQRSRIPLRKRKLNSPLDGNNDRNEMTRPGLETQVPKTPFQTTFTINNNSGEKERSQGTPVQPPGAFFSDSEDPFKDIASGFDVSNEDWMSTISQAFEGFSDFKKLRK